MSTVLVLAIASLAARSCHAEPPPGARAYRADFGGVVAADAREAEHAIVAGDVARRAARRFLDIELPPFLISMAPTTSDVPPAGCGFVFPWPRGRQGIGARRLPAHVLPHEIGHAVFIRFVMPRTTDDEYGGDAPDWLDEMAAMSFEDADGIRMRRGEARRHAAEGRLIPIRRLLSMTHPEWTARAAARSPASMATRGPASAETPAFYATVRALFDFLVDRTGNERVIPVLVARLRSEGSIETWLPGLVGNRARSLGLGGIDAALRTFVLDDPAFDVTDEVPPLAGGARQ